MDVATPYGGPVASYGGGAPLPNGGSGSRARHGRSSTPEHAGDRAIRRRMVRFAVLPAGLVALTSAAAVAQLVRAGGGPDGSVSRGVLAGALLLTCAVLVGAWRCAVAESRAVARRHTALVSSAAELVGLVMWLTPRRDGFPPVAGPRTTPSEHTGGALDLLGQEIAAARRMAEAAVAALREPGGAPAPRPAQAPAQVAPTGEAAAVAGSFEDHVQKVQVFANLAHRLQSLVHREIELLDDLENEVEDPDLLKGLFQVDHLATRIRRYAENLAVLGDAVSRRQWTRPVSVSDVLRSAVAEVENYSRVKLVPPVEGTLRGHAVADVVHLLSELVENATVFSAPQTQVLLRAQLVTAGLAIEVEDRGLGMTRTEQDRMNALLADPHHIALGELLQDGRIGLYVVSALATRHTIAVQLRSNIYGGTQAVLVLPHELLGQEDTETTLLRDPSQSSATASVRAPGSGVPPPREPSPPQAMPRSAAPHYAPGATAPDPRAPDLRAADPTAPDPAAPVPPPADGRPSLPRRHRQESLAPELREAPRPRTAGDTEHDPGLMAAFQGGFRRADTTGTGTGATPPDIGHRPPPGHGRDTPDDDDAAR
ncbi:ATP-binding protein [Streptomyces sp. NPDC048636]|uniref:sensor histidine kinase n=1 Tax=Streptomyces sp. NPDC048636 TaxID=3155762 RepID=UPI00343E8920